MNNNGNLLSERFGNDQAICYEYDEFDRLKVVNKVNDIYSYIYNSNGDISKVISNDVAV